MVWALAVTETISYGVLYYSFAAFLLPMQRGLGYTQVTLTGAFSLSVIVTGVMAVPVGAWLGRHGARGLMTAGSVVAAGCILVWADAHSIAGIYLAFAGIGIAGAAVLYEPAYVTINAWFDAQMESALLVLTIVAGLACTIFVPVSTALISQLGWRTALVILAGAELATAVPLGFLLRRRPADVGWRRDSLHEVEGTPAPLVPLRPEPPPPQYEPVSDRLAGTLWSRPVAMLTAGSVLGAGAIAAVSVLLLSYLDNRGFSLAVASAATGALGIIQVFGRVILTISARRITTSTATALMLGAQAAGVAALLLISNLAGVILFVLLFGAGYGVLSLARPQLLARYAARRFFAQVSGIQALLVTIGEALGPTGAAIVRRATGSYTLVFVIVALWSVAAAVLFLGANRAYRRAERRHLSGVTP